MNEDDGDGIWLSPKYWFVLVVLLVVPLGTSFALYGAREARLIRAANLLVNEVQSPADPQAAAWHAEDWIEYLTNTFPDSYRSAAELESEDKKSPFDGISIGALSPIKPWQLAVSADDQDRIVFIDVFGPDIKQPFYSREVEYPAPLRRTSKTR